MAVSPRAQLNLPGEPGVPSSKRRGLGCLRCQSATLVRNSRSLPYGQYRMRACTSCGFRFTTRECDENRPQEEWGRRHAAWYGAAVAGRILAA